MLLSLPNPSPPRSNFIQRPPTHHEVEAVRKKLDISPGSSLLVIPLPVVKESLLPKIPSEQLMDIQRENLGAKHYSALIKRRM